MGDLRQDSSGPRVPLGRRFDLTPRRTLTRVSDRSGQQFSRYGDAVSEKIHQTFLEIAADISPRLVAGMAAAGPMQLRKRHGQSLPDTLCRAVAGQQLSTKAAATIWQRILDQADSVPVVEFVSSSTPQILRACGLSGSKAKAMDAIAEAFFAGQLDEHSLRRLDHAERSRRLTSIWGVGQWTSDMIGIFYFGDQDVWPAGDMTVWKTLERLTDRRRKTSKTAERFAPHRSYLALYMYKIADANAQP